MSVSLSDSLLDLNCSATPNPNPEAERAEAVNASDENNGISLNNDEGAVGGRSDVINEGASGSSNGNRNGNVIAGPSRSYVPMYMEVDEDYREFCEQFGFEVSVQSS